MPYTLKQKLTAEFIGTFFMVLSICLTAVFGASQGVHPAFPVAGTLMVMIYALRHVSGAHFNPVVTLSLWIRGATERSEIIPYSVVQIIAGITGRLRRFFWLPEGSKLHVRGSDWCGMMAAVRLF